MVKIMHGVPHSHKSTVIMSFKLLILSRSISTNLAFMFVKFKPHCNPLFIFFVLYKKILRGIAIEILNEILQS